MLFTVETESPNLLENIKDFLINEAVNKCEGRLIKLF